MSDEIEVRELNEEEIVVRHYGEPVTLSMKEAMDLCAKLTGAIAIINQRKNKRRETDLANSLNTLEDLMNVDYRYVSGKAHDKFHKLWVQLFPFSEYGLYDGGGYWPATNQHNPKICMNRQLAFEPQAEKIKRVLPLVKTMPESLFGHPVGCRFLSIFERSLSRGASFHLVGYPDGSWRVSADRNSYHRIMFSSTDVNAALEYIYAELPYIVRPEEESEEND